MTVAAVDFQCSWDGVRAGTLGEPEVFAALMRMPPHLVRKHIRQGRFPQGVVLNVGGAGRSARYRLNLLKARQVYVVT